MKEEKTRKKKFRSSDPTYYSFFVLGLFGVAQFCLTFISIAVGDDFSGDMGIWAGLWHALVLLIAAYEDLRYEEHHLPLIIVLAVVVNLIMGFLAGVALWLFIAGFALMVICVWFSSTWTGALSLLMMASTSGLSIGGVLMAIFVVIAIISGVFGFEWFW